MAAFALSASFELPFMELEKVIFSHKKAWSYFFFPSCQQSICWLLWHGRWKRVKKGTIIAQYSYINYVRVLSLWHIVFKRHNYVPLRRGMCSNAMYLIMLLFRIRMSWYGHYKIVTNTCWNGTSQIPNKSQQLGISYVIPRLKGFWTNFLPLYKHMLLEQPAYRNKAMSI